MEKQRCHQGRIRITGGDRYEGVWGEVGIGFLCSYDTFKAIIILFESKFNP
ncbi:MAG: hypothetical protein IPG79_09500 [Saprospiraceae bacterium]|nr:hypothetical protein [Saprospiraceae bacterium]MBK6783971.1 hypothetical protein [Saprospiraceae bacterium]MBK8372429.1 hypothetical protein [Saprospiraceae bacterium]MBK8855025.1 hypothetical protein [Saprospiraceae bacterium]MBP6694431.1 hypothetical protein [Saprospiraceae bacterium]